MKLQLNLKMKITIVRESNTSRIISQDTASPYITMELLKIPSHPLIVKVQHNTRNKVYQLVTTIANLTSLVTMSFCKEMSEEEARFTLLTFLQRMQISIFKMISLTRKQPKTTNRKIVVCLMTKHQAKFPPMKLSDSLVSSKIPGSTD